MIHSQQSSTRETVAFYLLTFAVVTGAIVWILHQGSRLPPPAGIVESPAALSSGETVAGSGSVIQSVATSIKSNLDEPLGRLFLQLLIIIGASRIMGRCFVWIGQPSVIGEMLAGILLGPSLFGLIAPDLFAFVFPTSTFNVLKLLSQIGVCLFMFAVGMELNVGHVRERAQTAVVVSHASIVFPYVLGVGLAYFVYSWLAAPGAGFTPFALFMGISMSITAFPVLARILQERGLSRTFLGSTAITCAAVDDVTAWLLLAFVVAIARASNVAACVLSVGLVLVYIGVMVRGVKRVLPRYLGRTRLQEENPSKGTVAIIVCIVLASALTTELIGIHALFGAFLAGAIMPDVGTFRHKVAVRVENFSSVLLLPLFFAFTGLRTQIGLLGDAQSWLLCAGIILIATVGKLGGSALTARLTGLSWRDSLCLGALMNTRGLMELIALNIGYDLGILSPRIFAMLVIMALVTTMMTGPLLTLWGEKEQSLDELRPSLRPSS